MNELKNEDKRQTVDGTTAVSVAMGGVMNGTTTEFTSLFDGEITTITLIEDTISKSRSGSDRKNISLQSLSIVVDVVKVGAL